MDIMKLLRVPAKRSMLAVGLLFACFSTSFADESQTGAVVVARAGTHALILWDATSVVTADVQSGVAHSKALNGLEAQAITLAAHKAVALVDAQTVAVRVFYTRSGAVSPVYKTATFSGVEKVVTLTIARSLLLKKSAIYADMLSSGRIPVGVELQKTGELPAG